MKSRLKRKIRRHFRNNRMRYAVVALLFALIILAVQGAKFVNQGDNVHQDTVAIMIGTPDEKYTLALEQEASGDKEGARVAMLRLARLGDTLDNPLGYGKAHLWVVKDMVPGLEDVYLDNFPISMEKGKVGGRWSVDTRQLVERHLQHTVALNPEIKEAWRLLAALYLNEGKRNEAIRVLIDAIAHKKFPQPELHIALANACVREGDDLALREKMLHEFSALGSRLGAGNGDSLSLRVRYLTCALVLDKKENADVAIKRLEVRAKALVPGDSENLVKNAKWSRVAYHYHLAVEKFVDIEPGDSLGYGEVVGELEKVIRIVPACKPVIAALTYIARQEKKLMPRVDGILKRVLSDENLKDSRVRSCVMESLAMFVQDSEAKRLEFLESAIKSDSNNEGALLQLLGEIIKDDDVDYQRVEILANRLLKVNGANHVNEAYFYLGLVKIAANKKKEAIVYLEKSLAGSLDKSRIHELLAQCYDGVGRPMLAEQHRQITDSLEP